MVKEILQENGCGLVGKATPTSVFIVLIVVAGQCIKSQNKFRPIWTSLDQSGQVHTNLDSGHVHTNLDKIRPIWTSLDQFEHV